MNLTEGGNVFKDNEGKEATRRIAQGEIMPTVQWLEGITGLDFTKERDENDVPVKWLGSTGRKPDSGDLDLAVASSEITKDELAARLAQWCLNVGIPQNQIFNTKTFRSGWIEKTGISVHFKTPIGGNQNNGFVQTDFMFLKNPQWSQFVLTADPASAYKGALRNIMLNSMAKSMGFKLNQNDGIQDRATNTIISDDPDRVARLLLNPNATRADLHSVESIMDALKNDPKKDLKIADFKTHMEREGIPFGETVKEDSDVSFLARLRNRIVNLGMVAIMEDEEVSGGKAKGIEHIEDLVFRKGSKGIKQAIDILDHVAQNVAVSTVKWDGKPAVIFGRNPEGTFVLTDVSGFTARGYDGLFTSPQQLARQMAVRDETAAARGKAATRSQTLTPLYASLWPMLEASLPKNFRGYVQGDLLYTSQPPLDAGNYVFRPNTIEYRIPANSSVGQRIGKSEVGIAMHTYYDEPGAPKQPITANIVQQFKPVPGLLLIEPITPKEPVRAETKTEKELRELLRTQGRNIDQLFNPTELKQLEITNLPSLCVDYINSLVGDPNVTGFDNLLPNFGKFLQQKVSPRKYNNIVEYLQSPRSNLDAISAAFTAFLLLHSIKESIKKKLDLQHPGQEGWVFSTPAGIAKAVGRFDFSRANRAQNNPTTAA